jgi:hypothetical protein
LASLLAPLGLVACSDGDKQAEEPVAEDGKKDDGKDEEASAKADADEPGGELSDEGAEVADAAVADAKSAPEPEPEPVPPPFAAAPAPAPAPAVAAPEATAAEPAAKAAGEPETMWAFGDNVPVREAADATAKKVGKLKYGEKVTAMETVGEFVRIGQGQFVKRIHLTDRKARWGKDKAAH